MSGEWKKLKLIVAGVLLAASAGAKAPPTPPKPVLVRFQNLYWVGAKTVVPQIASGQVLVPPAEACDLLGLDCVLNGTQLSVGGQPLKVAYLTPQEQGLTPLAPLAKLAGQSVVWDAQSKTATVSGGSASRGWRSALDYLGQVQNGYAGPLRTNQTAVVKGRPTVQQTVFAASPLQDLSLFSKTAGSLNIVGGQRPSSPDVPNHFTGCGGKTTCTLPVPRDALWVLALVTAK